MKHRTGPAGLYLDGKNRNNPKGAENMRYTGFTILLAAGLVPGFAPAGSAAGNAADIAIVRNGSPASVIYVPESASPSEKNAADQLQQYIEACTGARLGLVSGKPAENTPLIAVGLDAAREIGAEIGAKTFGPQGYVMRSLPPHLILAGTPAAGTLYAVQDFLEEFAGVRWYAPGVEKTPPAKNLSVPADLDRVKTPAFLWRHTSYAWPGRDEAFLARQRDNNGGQDAAHPWGVEISHDGRCHTYSRFIRPSEFFGTHPEYFSEIGGVRRREETQLCLTNPEVLDIVTERMLERMKSRPGDMQHNFSQEDYYNYCECDACNAMNEKYGTKGGTQFWFVNQLAERTAKVYPDKQIGTLAYMYTEAPPEGMKMHPNVAVWLCHMFPSCDSHPIKSCPRDADYKRRALKWAEICDHLYIWHYIVDFAHYYNPFPNLRAMASDIRFYRDIGVEGIYLQGMSGGGGGGEFSLLRPWYGMQLLWNPDQDAEALIRDFLQGYYGAAWQPIYDYITMLHDKVENENIHMHLYTNPAQGYLPDETLEKAQALFDKAEAAAADDPELLERVSVCRMPLTYALSFPRNGYEIANGKLTFQPPFASMTSIKEFLDRMRAHGFQTIREMSGDPKQLAMLGALFSLPMDAPTASNDHLEIVAAPLLGGRLLKITHLESGECITANNITNALFFPFAGGEETRLGSYFRPAGFFDQYGVVKRSDSEIAVVAQTSGFNVRRSFRLEPGAPVVTITVELTNPGDKPREAILRSHLEYDLGELRETEITFTNRKGEKKKRVMEDIIPGLREGEHYYDDDAPAGAWTLTGSKGLAVTWRFPDEMLDYAWAYAYPEDLGELETELWLKKVTVPPGETMTFSHSLEVRPARE
jgi:hypothetical protein